MAQEAVEGRSECRKIRVPVRSSNLLQNPAADGTKGNQRIQNHIRSSCISTKIRKQAPFQVACFEKLILQRIKLGYVWFVYISFLCKLQQNVL